MKPNLILTSLLILTLMTATLNSSVGQSSFNLFSWSSITNSSYLNFSSTQDTNRIDFSNPYTEFQNEKNFYKNELNLKLLNFTIDTLDTVIFDLNKAVLIGNIVEFPVTFHSDDFIYALDFSLKFNNQLVEFDSLINITPGLNYLYYMNPIDSTLRFTSYRLGQLINDTAVVKLRFTSQYGAICMNDLNTIDGYLNGDHCSYKVTDCDTLTSSVFNLSFSKGFESIYPNPASDKVNVKVVKDTFIRIVTTNGKIVLNKSLKSSEEEHELNVSNLSEGLYFVHFISNEGSVTQKLLIQK